MNTEIRITRKDDPIEMVTYRTSPLVNPTRITGNGMVFTPEDAAALVKFYNADDPEAEWIVWFIGEDLTEAMITDLADMDGDDLFFI